MMRLDSMSKCLIAKVTFLLVLQGVGPAWPKTEPVFFNLLSEKMRGKDLYLAHSHAVDAINQLLKTKHNRQKYGPIVSDFTFSTLSEPEENSLTAMLNAMEQYFTLTGQKIILSAGSREILETKCQRQEKNCEFIIYALNGTLYDEGEDMATHERKTSASYLVVAGQNQGEWSEAEFPPSAHAVCQSLNPDLIPISFSEYLQGKKMNVKPYIYPLDDRLPFDLVIVLQLPILAKEKTVTFETISKNLKKPYQALVIGLDAPGINRVSVSGNNISDSVFLTAEITSYIDATKGCRSLSLQ